MQPREHFTKSTRALAAPFFLASAALLVAACASVPGRQTSGPRVRQELLVSNEWLATRTADPGVVVLHVGSDPAEYQRGHLPGARFLRLSAIVAEREGNINELPPVAQLDSVFESVGVSDGTRVVVYGAPLAAARAFFTLDYLGHGDHTTLLNGGLAGWRAAGLPVSTDAPHATRGAFTPRPVPGRVVDAEWVRARLRDPAGPGWRTATPW